MPLSWNDIKANALTFSREWQHAESEDADAQTFWNEFFEIFGVKRRRVAGFEHKVKKIDGKDGYIDLLWKGQLLIEHKSRGVKLDPAHKQARAYFDGLKDADLPQYILVSDFARFRLYDLEGGKPDDFVEFALKDLHKNAQRFGFIAGYKKQVIREQDPVNLQAVEKLGKLHDLLKQDGYDGHALEVLLVRLVFCLFADDTGIFTPVDSLTDLIETRTAEDGSDLGLWLGRLFQILNTPVERRQKSTDEQLAAFPYVNGRLFEERLDFPEFTRAMRDMLLDCCSLDWGRISPAIFGAMFQNVMEYEEGDRRRQLGAHYTSEANILKLIGPLFLDELRAEFERVKKNRNQLFEFAKKLPTLLFLDPACGCGNFLVITYRELRKLELDVLRAATNFGERTASVFNLLAVDIDQFYGIEIEEFPAQIAQVAMWLVDHQMNIEASELFGEPILRIPLTKSLNMIHGNALRVDWAEFFPPQVHVNQYILGNPPFIGYSYQTPIQKDDLNALTHGIKGAGVLDYVSGWYLKAAQYLTGNIAAAAHKDRKQFAQVDFSGSAVAPKGKKKQPTGMDDLFASAEAADLKARRQVRCAFVSTNSISQGEQVGVLWSWLLAQGIHIQFAHRTFQWSNDAPGKAAVHCVIIGFGLEDVQNKRLFEYAEIKSEPHEVSASNINPYLVDAPDVLIDKRTQPICSIPNMTKGSSPTDGGFLLMNEEQKVALMESEPDAAPFIKAFMSAKEFLNNGKRWCLWLENIAPTQLKMLPKVSERVAGVRAFRSKSTKAKTVKLAEIPTLFAENRQPKQSYLLVPRHSSENRRFIPVGFFGADKIVADSCSCIPNCSLFHFGIMSSTMHNAWVRSVCGRLKSDYRYSNSIVYNNFPWPSEPSDATKQRIEAAAQAVLDARAQFPGTSLATLYNPETMPPALVKAHATLDRAVDATYVPDGGTKSYTNDAARVAFLFRRYAALTSLI